MPKSDAGDGETLLQMDELSHESDGEHELLNSR